MKEARLTKNGECQPSHKPKSKSHMYRGRGGVDMPINQIAYKEKTKKLHTSNVLLMRKLRLTPNQALHVTSI